MMNGLETLIHLTEGFAARESCTDMSKKDRTVVCICVCVCVRGGPCVLLCVLRRFDRLVIVRWDEAEIRFSL